MIKIKEQIVDSEDVCKTVLGKVFGENHMFSLDEYDEFCTIIEQTLLHLKEDDMPSTINDVQIKQTRGHWEVYVNGEFFCTADK